MDAWVFSMESSVIKWALQCIMELDLTSFRWPGLQALLIQMICVCEYALMGIAQFHNLKETKGQVIICNFACLYPQENEPEVDSALSQRASEVKYMTYKVNKFGLEVAILGTKIDALRSGPRSLSRSLWHKITHLGFRISRLARPIRFQSRIRSTIRRYRYREQAGSSSPSVERVHEDEDETPEQQQQDQAPKSGISENEEGPESHKSESETAFQSYSRKGKAPIIDPPSSTSLHNQDEIEADQLVLSQEVDRILAKVKDLKCQALDLRSKSSSKAKPKSPICSEPPPTRPNMVAEWQKRGLTNTTEPLSLFQRNWELADKISFLELQVENLRSLVTDLESQSRIRFGSRISRYFKQRGRSSPKSS